MAKNDIFIAILCHFESVLALLQNVEWCVLKNLFYEWWKHLINDQTTKKLVLDVRNVTLQLKKIVTLIDLVRLGYLKLPFQIKKYLGNLATF